LANSFWQREKGMKKMNSTVFKVWKTRKLWKAFGKEEEEEVQRDLEINWQKFVVKRIVKRDCLKCKSKSCFYRLFMSGQENHYKSYNL